MTSIGAVKRALAQLSPEQRARLQALVESQPAPEPMQPHGWSSIGFVSTPMLKPAKPPAEARIIERVDRDMGWRHRQPVFSDPLEFYR
ncbi:MAG: hypothetical protein E5X53_12465 [Mesorhizobium sp.]|uniref:hypothetical protein n=1 Tax=Mesorhizobium sp. TaxID=1871066 RepID=UPI001210E08C|nr:hypothetical protein [Mesorhizobium sp.]TIP74847.1 MAG: hypothetical protein E5X55_07835 [Mesorhizobium sp.]TIQ14641.1 MAG: hypothetical protein E5X57_04080 [Mesorhizobium sp.]TIR52176.1 MAG: hypothetical protein E5X53_12465 [Mesorhizobium sp.]TJV96268.1 MAG: hypothetical protein E5X52_19655 [Mesorhizobium sp.]